MANFELAHHARREAAAHQVARADVTLAIEVLDRAVIGLEGMPRAAGAVGEALVILGEAPHVGVAVQHLCSHRRLVDYPNLWAYARDLYSWQGVAATLDLDAMRAASYAAEAHGIVPIAPHADWSAPHAREALGSAHLALRSGQTIEVEPTTLGHREG